MASKLRSGIIASALLTMILSVGAAYLSIWVVKDLLFVSLGLVLSIVLLFLSALILKGNFIALATLSSFYLVLSILGLLMTPYLPSEGILLFVFSVLIGTYLLRHRNDPFREEGYKGDESYGAVSEEQDVPESL